MRRLVLVSYTPIGSSGGVPRWNRDIRQAFPEAAHYSWWDVAREMRFDPNDQRLPEWEKARTLSRWLLKTGKVSADDVVVADSFWADGLEHLPGCVSLQHGNWSHTTKDDVDRGIPPEFPEHAAVQLDFRRRYVAAGRKLVACSFFISEQMKFQWGFESTVINNGIDLTKFFPADEIKKRNRPIIVHFTTTQNKGLDHIRALRNEVDADVFLLDELGEHLKLPKYRALAQADLAVHPSAHEGNSYAVLETLASGVPIVSYDVGLMYEISRMNDLPGLYPGVIESRRHRKPERTVEIVKKVLGQDEKRWNPRACAEAFSLEKFHMSWKEYLKREHGYGA